MLSAKVSVGDTATATQYNNLRADAMSAGYYPIEEVDSDDTNVITCEIVGDAATAVFGKSATATCYFDVQIPPYIDTGVDWSVRLAFDMKTTEASKNVRLSLEYAAVADAGDTTPSVTTLNETVACPDTLETLKVVTLSTIKIPAASLSSGKLVTFKLSRLSTDGADTHGGSLRIFEIQLIQTQP